MVADKDLIINPKYTYSKSEYARRFALNRVTLDKLIKDGTIKTIIVQGVILITTR